jgi:ferredoxin
MDIASSELTKYAANAMLATRISFMNEIANLCEHLGADINQVRKGMASDSRIGSKFLYAGTGYGGSCFPKDVKALIKTGNDIGLDMNIVVAVEKTNEFQKSILFRKMKDYFNGDFKNKNISIEQFFKLHENFLADKRLEGISERTMHDHITHIYYLKTYVLNEKRSDMNQYIDAEFFKSYIYYMMITKEYKPCTVNIRLTSLKCYLRWRFSNKFICENYSLIIKKVKRPEDEIKPLLTKVVDYVEKINPSKNKQKYIENGGWRARMGGRGLKNGGNRVTEVIDGDKIIFHFTHKTGNWLDVCKILGKIVEQNNNNFTQIIVHQSFALTVLDVTVIYSPFSKMDRFLISRLRGVANKVAYCVGCKACVVQCPEGAFEITDKGKILIREEY